MIDFKDIAFNLDISKTGTSSRSIWMNLVSASIDDSRVSLSAIATIMQESYLNAYGYPSPGIKYNYIHQQGFDFLIDIELCPYDIGPITNVLISERDIVVMANQEIHFKCSPRQFVDVCIELRGAIEDFVNKSDYLRVRKCHKIFYSRLNKMI